METSAYILGAARPPIGKLLGSLASEPAPRLAAVAARRALEASGLAATDVEQVILGQVLSAGAGQAPARQAAIQAGVPVTAPALTINQVCGSGLQAAMLAAQAIRLGEACVVLAGGMESMSQAPYLSLGARGGLKFGHQQLLDSLLHDGLWCAHENTAMGSIADRLAAEQHVSRADQDAWAMASHQRAVAAMAAGSFRAQIAPVEIRGRKGSTIIDRDEGPRPEVDAAALARLPAAFGGEGTVTAGNASQISDGAAALVVTDEATARACRPQVAARIVAQASAAVAPKELFVAPVVAIQRVLEKARLKAADIDLFELNEAFAVQCLACTTPLHIDPQKVNVHGGAIALGHPIGASGARVLVTLLHALAERQKTWGLAALCLGGGGAVAMIVERMAP